MDQNLGSNNFGLLPSRTSRFPVVTVAVIVAAVILAAGWFFYSTTKGTKNISSVSPTPTFQITSLTVKQTLLTKATLKFPDIVSSAQIAEELLPSDFKPFIVPNATLVSLEKVVYSSGKIGYRINLTVNQSVENSFNNSLTHIGRTQWQRLSGVRANLFAFLELASSQYELREEFSFLDTSNTKVTILALHK